MLVSCGLSRYEAAHLHMLTDTHTTAVKVENVTVAGQWPTQPFPTLQRCEPQEHSCPWRLQAAVEVTILLQVLKQPSWLYNTLERRNVSLSIWKEPIRKSRDWKPQQLPPTPLTCFQAGHTVPYSTWFWAPSHWSAWWPHSRSQR